ncbi:MAG: hypothetical protein DDT19_02311 [Syntrophomonadaceae bacterium]|nr:hypothetical protein [Bacillota bacterium]
MTGLHPLHLADLKKSGLSDLTIKEAGIKTVPPNDINKKLGFNIPDLISCYEIPYNNSFGRFRGFYDSGKEGPKYLQRKGTGNRLYIPQRVKPILDDPFIPLYIAEGEKKALKACQEGLYCIAVSGLWNWSNGKKELISEFDQIAFEGRTIYIVPDNDWLQPNKHGYIKNLKQAVYELADRLKIRGAKVFIVELPQGELKEGLDDFLCGYGVEEFNSLPLSEVKSLSERIAEATTEKMPEILRGLAEIQSETERAILVEALSKKLGIGKRFIQSDIKKLSETGKKKLSETGKDRLTVHNAHFSGLVDLVFDKNGNVAFLIKDKDFLRVATIWKNDGLLYSPPEKAHLPFALPNAKAVISWYESDNDQKLFEDVIAYLKRFSYLTKEQLLIIACKVVLTYIQDHLSICYLPMILFYSVPERGKSRTGKAAIYISYRGVHCVDIRESNLFRFAQDLRATLFLDIMDLWKKAERNGSEDILLLRYERGAKATRVLYPEKGAFKDTVYYDVYGPTFIATNEAIHEILDSRSIPITMPNKPGDYENPTPEKAQELKERLTAWRARAMDISLPEIERIEGLSGRLWDISKPLLQVCKLVYPQGFGSLKEALFEVAGQRIEDKKASIEGQIISILYELSPEGENVSDWIIKTHEVLGSLNRNRPEIRKLSPQYLGRKLKAMGIKTRKVHGYSEVVLKRTEFNTFLIQYGIIDAPTPIETLPNSTTLKNEGISTGYAGRELVESEGNSTQTLPIKSLDNQALRSLVESGRELCNGREKRYLKTLRWLNDF